MTLKGVGRLFDSLLELLKRAFEKIGFMDKYPSLYSPTTKEDAKYAVIVNYPLKSGEQWVIVCYAIEKNWRMLLSDAVEKWSDLDVLVIDKHYPGYHRAVSTAKMRHSDERYRDWWMRSEL